MPVAFFGRKEKKVTADATHGDGRGRFSARVGGYLHTDVPVDACPDTVGRGGVALLALVFRNRSNAEMVGSSQKLVRTFGAAATGRGAS